MQGAAAFADQFLELRQILSSQGHQASEVHNSACKLMRVLLSFPLLGRPASSKQPFLASIHCYWAKFLFNAACQLLATLVPDAVAVHREVEVLFTFIGPAPRSLYATLQSNQKSKRQHMQCLDNLREVRSWVEATFGCSHSLYNLQVSPCDWQHFIRARLTFPGYGSLPLPGSRGGSLSTTKQLLLNISNLEEELIRQREAALQRLNWLVDKWMVSRLHFRRMVFFCCCCYFAGSFHVSGFASGSPCWTPGVAAAIAWPFEAGWEDPDREDQHTQSRLAFSSSEDRGLVFAVRRSGPEALPPCGRGSRRSVLAVHGLTKFRLLWVYFMGFVI